MLRCSFFILLICCTLTACGNKGPLVLPDPAPAPAPPDKDKKPPAAVSPATSSGSTANQR